MNEPAAIIFDIQKCAVHDGPGIRTTIFFKGCNLRCRWCHNPESQNMAPEVMVKRTREETAGRVYSVSEVVKIVLGDRIFYETSGGGATFSGGECMLQIDFLEAALKELKANGIHTAVDTAGSVPFSSFERILPFTDLFLYDVKCFSEALHREGTGESNKLILENLSRLVSAKADVLVRIPIIPGFNTAEEELAGMSDFLRKYSLKTELLPYHTLGISKYEGLHREAERFPVPEKAYMKEIQEKYFS